MKKELIFTSLLFVLGFHSIGQNNYTPLKSEGIIPNDFVLATKAKIKEDVLEIENSSLSRKEQKYKTDFVFGSNFGVDAMLLNGSVLYNDSISNYVKKVAKEVLREDLDLYNKLRFYTIKDETANAFTTANGIIFVTTGLMARLQNEAQLAFILCHEISHYTLEDGETDYVKKQKVINGDKGYKGVSLLEKMHLIFGYSKKSEFEADEEGLSLFLKTDYYKGSAISSFEILMHSDEPILDMPFDFASLQGESYQFPERYFLDELKEKIEYSDTFSTHPSANKRMYNVEDIIGDDEIGGDSFIVSKTEFERVKYLSCMESLLAQIKLGSFLEALHNANNLKQIYPANSFIRNIETYCMYSLSKAALYGDKADYIIAEDFGNLSETNFFFKKIQKNDLLFLSVEQSYMNYSKEMSNAFAGNIFKDLVRDMVRNEFYFDQFKKEKWMNADSIIRDSSFYFNRRGKKLTAEQVTKRIKREKKRVANAYCQYSFVGLFKEGDKFETIYKEIEKEVKDEIELEEETFLEKEEETMLSLNVVKKGISVGIDSVLFIYPSFKQVVVKKEGVIERKGKKKLRNTLKEEQIVESFERNAKKMDMHFDVLKERGEEALNTERYNGRAMIFSSIMDRAAVGFREQLIFNGQYVGEIKEQFGTSNIAFMSMIDINYPGTFDPLHIPFIFLTGLGLPAVIYLAIPKGNTIFSFVIINLESGKIPFYYGGRYDGTFSKKKMDMHTFHILNQVKSKK